MEKIKTDIYTIGHKNPDADSVCSAIAMAELRGCIAAAAGNLNRETDYILETFGVKGPVILDDITGKTLILVDHNKLEHAAKGIHLPVVHLLRGRCGAHLHPDCRAVPVHAEVLRGRHVWSGQGMIEGLARRSAGVCAHTACPEGLGR